MNDAKRYNNSPSLKLLQINAHSLIPRLPELERLASREQIDIIAVQET